MSNYFFFIGLPYAALVIMIIGSTFRYFNFGFKVSSLSSQFLEGRELFYGSQPFHWGLVFLFFGHLIAFLFPSSVIAWNSMPWRLLILEISAFGFGILSLVGLVLLILRRIRNKRLHLVTSTMDVVVYVILTVQIITGLWLAFTVRWGSAWFASVLSPYLESIFTLNPDIKAVAELPFIVRLHLVSAFTMIAIIPFTRFMHFLVFPFSYLWRSYQYVIWNWDRTKIRNSSSFYPGKKSRNN
jgi:nitrate reductase gamma subunit